MALIDAVINGFPERREEASPCVGSFWAIRHDLSVDDGLVLYQSRIVMQAAGSSSWCCRSFACRPSGHYTHPATRDKQFIGQELQTTS